MKETEMGYHESKLEFVSQIETVKKQWVDSSWIIKAKSKKNAFKVYSNGFWKKLSNQMPF